MATSTLPYITVWAKSLEQAFNNNLKPAISVLPLYVFQAVVPTGASLHARLYYGLTSHIRLNGLAQAPTTEMGHKRHLHRVG